MRVYSISPQDNVQLLDLDVKLQTEILLPLGRGNPYLGDWLPLTVRRLQKSGRRRLEKLCDLTSIGASCDIPVLSEKAKRIFEPIFGNSVQWLPLSFEDREYWIINCLNVLNALDPETAKVSYLPNGKVWGIDEYGFIKEVIENEWIFKVPQSTFYVLSTNRFYDLVQREGLTGFFFQPVWDSEHAPFRPTGRTKYIIGRPEIYGPEGFVPNVREQWPPEWIEQEKEMKKKARQAAKLRLSQT